jgi:hypothetical protein
MYALPPAVAAATAPTTVPKGVNNSRAGDMAKGGWAGAYSKFTPNENIKQGIVSAVACESHAT